MTTHVFRARSLSEAMRKIREIGAGLPEEIKPKIIRGLQSAAYRGVSVVVDKIETTSPFRPVDTGGMKRSTRARKTKTGARLGVYSPHAIFMERGTRPHWPPLGPLAEWAHAKGLADDEDEAGNIAFLIAANMSVHGTKPRWFFRRAMRDMVRSVIPDEISRALHNG